MVRELHQGTRLTKGMFLCTKSVSLFFTSQYVMSPLKCRKEAPIDAAGPSQAKNTESSEEEEEEHTKEEEDTHQEEAQEGYSRPTYYCC